MRFIQPFKTACNELGLLEDDNYWTHCFTEVSLWRTGSQLRLLFISALIYGELLDPLSLWMQFRIHICDDLPHRLHHRNDIPNSLVDPHFDYGLFLINDRLQGTWDKSIETFHLPSIQFAWGSNEGNRLLREQYNYDQGS